MAAFVEPLSKVEGELDFANEVSKIEGETVNKIEEEEYTAVFEGSAKDTEEEEELKASEKFPGGKIDSDVGNSLNDDAVLPSNALDLRLGKKRI